MKNFRNLHIYIGLKHWVIIPEFEKDELEFYDKETPFVLLDYEMRWLCFRFNIYFLK